MRVLRIFISPGHNFVGHYGQAPGRHPLLEVSQVECVAGQGLMGDRYFGRRPDYKGQITFFSAEVLSELHQKFGKKDLSPGAHRRNVLMEGVDLSRWIGREFEIQRVHFFGTEESQPCGWMDQVYGEGAEQWLRGRGGLRAMIRTDGTLVSSEPIWVGANGSDGSDGPASG